VEELVHTIHPPPLEEQTQIKVEEEPEPPPQVPKPVRKMPKKWNMNPQINRLKTPPKKKKKTTPTIIHNNVTSSSPPINTLEQWTAAVFSPAPASPTIAVKSAPLILKEEEVEAYPLFQFDDEEEEEATFEGSLTFEDVEVVDPLTGNSKNSVSCTVCQEKVPRSLLHQHLAAFHYKTVHRRLMCVDCGRKGVADETGKGVMASHCRMHFRRRQLGFPN
jgi:hypothetical protein